MNLYIIEWRNSTEERNSYWGAGAVADKHEAVDEFYKYHPHMIGAVISVYEYKGAYLNAEPN